MLSYLCTIINISSAKYKSIGGAESKLFFTCLDDGAKTDAAIWLTKVKQKLKSELFERAKKKGALTDESATPIYGYHFRAMVRRSNLQHYCFHTPISLPLFCAA